LVSTRKEQENVKEKENVKESVRESVRESVKEKQSDLSLLLWESAAA
jgi:hypothetical protein